jgi:hypothetical protein
MSNLLGSCFVVATILALPSGAAQQRIDTLQAPVPLALEGFVLTPEGAPALGASITTSGGGQALSDGDGHYRLTVLVPAHATAIEVTAIRDGLVAVQTVEWPGNGGDSWAAPLVLSQPLSCRPGWQRTLGGEPGTSHFVFALTTFDDGNGPAVYAGGSFESAGGAECLRVGRWDGRRWSALGSGMNDTVEALHVFDDGTGAALYAGGKFTQADGQWASRVARWDGTSWSPLDTGLTGDVHALATYDDGTGPALYAAGDFDLSGSATMHNIARWDGTFWRPVGSGLVLSGFGGYASALGVFDDGSGPKLYAGGRFDTAGGLAANNIASWDGTQWSPLGSGLTPWGAHTVEDLEVFDDGSGPALYVAGSFTAAGGIPADRLARWDGSSWSALAPGPGCDGCDPSWSVLDLQTFDDGTGPALLVGGYFASAGGIATGSLARWDGTTWTGFGIEGSILALASTDLGQGPAFVVGGSITEVDGRSFENIALHDGRGWHRLGGASPNEVVYDITVHDDGNGEALYASGYFSEIDDVPLGRVARWDGVQWTPLGPGLVATGDRFTTLESFDDGSGPALYCGGDFDVVDGVTSRNVIRWRNGQWEPLGSGIGGLAVDLIGFDDGSGAKLYALNSYNPPQVWDGSTWTTSTPWLNGSEYTATVFDDGTGPALYIGGVNIGQAGSPQINGILKLQGGMYSPVGTASGSGAAVYKLAVFDDGSGPALYAGGVFTSINGVPANDVARWDGTSWSPLGAGLIGDTHNHGGVLGLVGHDDGRGPALFAVGGFWTADGLVARHAARWDGTSWSALGGGTNEYPSSLAVFDDGHGPALFVGGSFTSCIDSRDARLARWGCPPLPRSSPWSPTVPRTVR